MKKAEIKKAIEGLNIYFVSKIAKGQFKVVKTEPHHVTVLIDNQFEFMLWTSNGVDHLSIYNNSFVTSFMQLIFTKKDKLKCWKHLSKLIDNHYKNVTLKNKRKQLAALKLELGES